MKKLYLEDGTNYLIVSECDYDNKKYLFLINENDDRDFKFMELLNNSTLKEVLETSLLKEIIYKMLLHIYKFEE